MSAVSRGAAVGDVDNDGDPDAIVLNNNGRAHFLLNQLGQDKAWIGLRLRTRGDVRDALGARIRVVDSAGQTRWRRARSDASYCSSNDPRILLGLGEATARSLDVYWPDGTVEAFDPPPVNQYTTIVQGTGRATVGEGDDADA